MPDAPNANTEAQDALMTHVFVPAFTKRCADRGLSIESPEQLGKLLGMATKIGALQALDMQKQANESLSVIDVGDACLDDMIKQAGLATDDSPPADLPDEAVQAAKTFAAK